MDISLPLDKMTDLDKIATIEKLWDDLCRDPEAITSPTWHKDVLEAREKEIMEGKAKFTPSISDITVYFQKDFHSRFIIS